MKLFALSFLIAFITFEKVNGLAVMSIDFGSEWMKVGIVLPGVPMEIALNKESKRKTPSVISFRNDMREFGEEAQNIGLRFPTQSYGYLLDLLGKDIDHPLVKLYAKRFPYYNIVPDLDRGTILFKHDSETFFSPEELVAQLLAKAKEFAENSAGQQIKDCVITVPGFFNQIERKAMLQAAQLAGLKVLQLINDYTAVSINYGIFRYKNFNETAQYVMFYDMGASSTSATLVKYQTVKVKERGYVETHPQAAILGVGYDRTLGGLEIQIRLRDYLAKKFNELKKTKDDVFKNPRAMAKLFKEAGRLKNILSANTEHYAQVEGLINEQDFKLLVTRQELENLITDLLKRIVKPVTLALNTANLSIDLINEIVLVGGGIRMPKIKEILQTAAGKDLAQNINADEAATMGAVYKAAELSTGFKVKTFLTKDAVLFPIHVLFKKQSGEGNRTVKRTLFGLMNPYPQKKVITFNKHVDDFSFTVNYAELDYLPVDEIVNIGSQNVSEYKLTGVASALQKHLDKFTESKGIKAHFNLDESGILKLANVELIVEKTPNPDEDEGTLSKIGSTFSKLFGGSDEKVKEEPPVEKDAQETSTNNTQKEGETNSTNSEQQNSTNQKNETETVQEDVKLKPILIKEPIEATEKILSINLLNENQFNLSLDKIKHLDKIEKDMNRRANALNSLESFIVDVQNKFYETEYTEAATEDEVENIQKACSEVSEWLYEDGSDADVEVYEKKLKELKSLTRDIFVRVWEHRERPEALKALDSMLNHSSVFLKTALNLSEAGNPEIGIFKDSEIKSLEKLVNETVEWKDKNVNAQAQLKKYETPKLTVKQISDKITALDREVKYLLNKLRYQKPKPVEKPVEEKSEDVEKNGEKTDSKNPDSKKTEKTEKTEKSTDGVNKSKKADIENNTTETESPQDSHSEL